MIDARLSGHLLTDARFWKISADAWRLYCAALLWSVTERTDGRLIAADLPYVLPLADLDRAPELVEVGLWVPRPGGWDIADFAATQTRAAVLDAADHARAHEREKKARQRAHKRGDHRLCDLSNCPGTIPDTSQDSPEHVPGTTQERTGQDRTGAFKGEEHSLSVPIDETEVQRDGSPDDDVDPTRVEGQPDYDDKKWLNYGDAASADAQPEAKAPKPEQLLHGRRRPVTEHDARAAQALALEDCCRHFGSDCYADTELTVVYEPGGDTWWTLDENGERGVRVYLEEVVRPW